MKSSNNKIDDSYIIADLKVKNNNNKFEMLTKHCLVYSITFPLTTNG